MSATISEVGEERRVEDTRSRLAAIVQSSLDAIIGKETNGTVTSWNPAATELFGWTVDEMVGRSINVLVPEQRRDEEADLLLRVAAGARIEPYETERLTKAGETIPVALSCSPIKNSTGAIDGVASIYIDIGWIKKREGMLQALLEASQDAIVGVDSDGVVQVVNAQAETLFGYERGELLGRPVKILIPERLAGIDADRPSGGPAPRTQRPMGTGLELSARHKDGREFPVDVAMSSLETDEGIIGVAVRDISERVNAAQEKERLERQLDRTRLESIGQLVGGIAHDFNNLLAGIMSFSRLIGEQLKEIADENPSGTIEQVQKDLDQVVLASERAASLIRQLLLFGRRDVAEAQFLDLNEIVSGMEDLLRRTIGERISLVTDLTRPLGAVHLDSGHFEQILMNLVVNARDAIPSDGCLTLSTCERTFDAAHAASQGIGPGDYVALSVTDTGSGMPPEVIARVFEPYFTTKPRGEGSGLGLATVYGIVAQAGGHIDIVSEMGRGTTVTAYLPLVEGIVTAPTNGAVGVAGAVAGETILLVEDEEIVREPAARFLRRAGYKVLVAGEAATAIDLAAAHTGTIDLLLTDVVMPGMTGKELAEKLLISASIDRVLYTSGYTQDVISRGEGVDTGVTLLAKPFTADQLLAGVRDLLDEQP